MLEFNTISLNVRGLRLVKKRTKIFHWLKKHGADKGISLLQETHATSDSENEWKTHFRGDIIFSHGSSKSRGVAVLIGPGLECSIIDRVLDEEGRLVILKCVIQGSEFLIINTYFPNTEKEQTAFLRSLYEKLSGIEISAETSIIWGGDFNHVTNIDLETKGGNPQLKFGTIELVSTIKEELDLCDIWRIRNPEIKRYTWKGHAQGVSSAKGDILCRRLDYFLISDHLQPVVKNIDIIVALKWL